MVVLLLSGTALTYVRRLNWIERTKIWVYTGVEILNFPFTVFLIAYLLVALLLVFKLCQKFEGPIKRFKSKF